MGQDFLDIQYIRYVLDPNPGVQIEPEIDPSENRIQIFQKPRTDPAKIPGSATLTKRIILSATYYLLTSCRIGFSMAKRRLSV